ncbi:MAG: ATP-binding protein [Provencibacterium sp.]|nr:ATP-binding protein [Provencibacterium sp.]
MVLLIGGGSHAGKTLMAQRLLERYHYPYTSIDHIKMGLIRGSADCGFTALDSDRFISQKLWSILKGMVDTCLENRQNLILEGCYLPPEEVARLQAAHSEVVAVYLLLSRDYITRCFSEMLRYESVIEKRGEPEERGMDAFIEANEELKAACRASGVRWFEIQENYQEEIQEVYRYFDEQISERERMQETPGSLQKEEEGNE